MFAAPPPPTSLISESGDSDGCAVKVEEIKKILQSRMRSIAIMYDLELYFFLYITIMSWPLGHLKLVLVRQVGVG
jgi:hypothetical protein